MDTTTKTELNSIADVTEAAIDSSTGPVVQQDAKALTRVIERAATALDAIRVRMVTFATKTTPRPIFDDFKKLVGDLRSMIVAAGSDAGTDIISGTDTISGTEIVKEGFDSLTDPPQDSADREYKDHVFYPSNRIANHRKVSALKDLMAKARGSPAWDTLNIVSNLECAGAHMTCALNKLTQPDSQFRVPESRVHLVEAIVCIRNATGDARAEYIAALRSKFGIGGVRPEEPPKDAEEEFVQASITEDFTPDMNGGVKDETSSWLEDVKQQVIPGAVFESNSKWVREGGRYTGASTGIMPKQEAEDYLFVSRRGIWASARRPSASRAQENNQTAEINYDRIMVANPIGMMVRQ